VGEGLGGESMLVGARGRWHYSETKCRMVGQSINLIKKKKGSGKPRGKGVAEKNK